MTVRLNAWMAQYASEQTGLVISDPWNAWADPATGLPLSDITEDGTHPSSIGAFAEARVHLQTLAQLLDADRRGPSVGNLLPNGLMFGVDGRRGKGIAGEVADRFAVTTSQATNSGGIVCSKEARASGGEWQVICLDQRAGGHEAVTLEQVLEYDAGTYAPDDRIEMSADIEVSASSGLAGVSARLIEYAGEGLSPYAAFDMVPNATVAGPSSAYVGTAATPPLTIRTPGDSGSRRLACRVMIHGIADGCSCIVKVGALTVRKAHEA